MPSFSAINIPERELAILSCMDARMVELLPRALGLKNGDAKLIKNAGAVVTHPWGSVMRSLLVAVLELKVKEIMVVAHYDCGMRGLNADAFLGKARSRAFLTTAWPLCAMPASISTAGSPASIMWKTACATPWAYPPPSADAR